MSYDKIVVAKIDKYKEMKISGDIPSKERDAIKEYHDWILTAYRGRRIVVREMARKVNNGTLKPSHLTDMSKQIDEANKQLAYAKNGIKEVAGQNEYITRTVMLIGCHSTGDVNRGLRCFDLFSCRKFRFDGRNKRTPHRQNW